MCKPAKNGSSTVRAEIGEGGHQDSHGYWSLKVMQQPQQTTTALPVCYWESDEEDVNLQQKDI